MHKTVQSICTQKVCNETTGNDAFGCISDASLCCGIFAIRNITYFTDLNGNRTEWKENGNCLEL
jgi:hypothetical protein